VADINVLIVADGIFSFGPQVLTPGNPDERDVQFTISEFTSILRDSKRLSIQNPSISVTTAHRAGDLQATITTPFNFKTSVSDLTVFHVIWLFGDEGTNFNAETGTGAPTSNLAFIQADEVSVIADFMDGGGGVFATGDHEGLGSLMCGLIPRVRSMRAWFSVADIDPRIPTEAPRNWVGTGSDRADTLQAASDKSWSFDNQSDDIAQPLHFPNGTKHPILQGANGPISQFPDHMHEGQVILPWTYSDQLIPSDPRKEYPTVNGHQERPIILATGQTIGGHPSPTTDASACEQNNFFDETVNTRKPGFTINALGAYDVIGA
jgi:hypothetical protein